MGYPKISEQTRKSVVDYANEGKSYKEICELTGVSSPSIARILKADRAMRLCRKCGKKLPTGSKFCMECGARVMTESEEVAEQLVKLRSHSAVLPETIRAEFDDATSRAIKYLEQHKN